jgi:hypothetical protein
MVKTLGISRREFGRGTALALGLPFLGCTPALAAPAVRKYIDLRTEIGSEALWVVFLGRRPDVLGGAFVGHAFVGLGQEDESRKMSWLEGFGLSTQSSALGGASLVIGPVPGKLAEEENSLSDISLSCRVGRAQFEAVKAVRARWGSRPDYALIYQDCVTFTLDAALALGLKLPGRESLPDSLLLPIAHMERLASLNSTEDFPFGDWASSDQARRWRLLLNLEKGTWTEKAASGSSLERPARVIRLSDRSFRVERDNTTEVLTFLGAREGVRTALLQRGVRPSYMVLTRTDAGTFSAQWFGLKWTLDAQGKLNTIAQPGEAPGSAYTLTRKV